MTHMSLDQARKIMGDDAPDTTDEELDQIILDLEVMARMAIRDFRINKDIEFTK